MGVKSQSQGLNGQSFAGHVEDSHQRVLRMKWVLWGKSDEHFRESAAQVLEALGVIGTGRLQASTDEDSPKTAGEESTCQCRRHRNRRFEPWVGKIPLENEVLECSCLEKPMDRGAWRAAVHGVAKESDTTEYSYIPQCSHASFIPSAFSHFGCMCVHHSSHRRILMP